MEKEEFNGLFGEFVRHKRKELGWKQETLADNVGVDFQSISRLERGEINPSIHWISELAKGFKTTLGELMTEFDQFVIKKSKEPSRLGH